MSSNEAIYSWLNLLCQMVPGVKQAVYVIESNSKLDSSSIQWPDASPVNQQLFDEAVTSIEQQRMIDKVLSPETHSDQVTDMIIACYFDNLGEYNGALSILLNAKSSQRPIVIQMLQWGGKWLQLLLEHYSDADVHATKAPHGNSKAAGFFSKFSFTPAKVTLSAGILVCVLSYLVKGTYYVSAPANIEGKIQRAIVSPFDSYIQTSYARAGERVTAGDVVAELDKQELILEQQKYRAQLNEYNRQYRQALARREMADLAIFKSQMRQVDAQLELIEKKINRSSLVAPIDGVIISGDLTRSLGAPVKTGDVLFEIAPLDEYRLIVMVDEKQVADVRVDMQGTLKLRALPTTDIEFVVRKVSPVFEDKADSIAYRVEAALEGPPGLLRPGMQGSAKIAIKEKSYAWIYLHELYYAIRFWLWSRWL